VKIGIFDSGVGGLSVVNSVRRQLPHLEIVYKDDKKHVPYGNRQIEEIHSFIRPIFQSFIDEGCQVIVVACNTVSTNLISSLRKEFSVPMVAMEPMVKPAAVASQTKIITVCATPRTLSSDRYRWLKEQFARDVKVLEPDCSDWANMVESNSINRKKIAKTIEETISRGSDQIVLGCTHYHWVEDLIKEISAGRAEVMQPEVPVISQLKRVLEQLS
jgi:glutamate racemase